MSKKRKKKKYSLTSEKIYEPRKPSRYPLARCKHCKRKYYAVEKDAETGEVLREFRCWDTCFYVQYMNNSQEGEHGS